MIGYLTTEKHEIYGPYNENGLKELISSCEILTGRAFEDEKKAQNFVKDRLKTVTKWIANFIGRDPDVIKQEDYEIFGVYSAWNLNAEEAEKIKDWYPDAIDGGALEIYMSYYGIEIEID